MKHSQHMGIFFPFYIQIYCRGPTNSITDIDLESHFSRSLSFKYSWLFFKYEFLMNYIKNQVNGYSYPYKMY